MGVCFPCECLVHTVLLSVLYIHVIVCCFVRVFYCLYLKQYGHLPRCALALRSFSLLLIRRGGREPLQLNNKCSFCSIKIIFISKIPPFGWRGMFRNPQARAGTTGQTKIPNSIHKVRRNMSNGFYNQSSGCFYNK